MMAKLSDAEQTSLEDAARAALHRLATRLAHDVKVLVDVRFRDFPAEGILDAAKSEGVDLIVLASHARTGMTRWLL